MFKEYDEIIREIDNKAKELQEEQEKKKQLIKWREKEMQELEENTNKLIKEGEELCR